LKLAGQRGRKRSWWFGFNGERLARNSDSSRLAEHCPEVYAWVLASLAGKAEPPAHLGYRARSR
jgi:hypothetical protein